MPIQSRSREIGKSDGISAVGVVADQHVYMPEHAVHRGDEALGGRGVAKIAGHVHKAGASAERGTQFPQQCSKIV